MQLTQTTSLRLEQRQLLTPRMIQSMEILQLPLMALEERIEQELQNNPVLEVRENDPDEPPGEAPEAAPQAEMNVGEGDRALVVGDSRDGDAQDFERLARISEYLENEEFSSNSGSNFRQSFSEDGERDRKMDALNNHAARGITLAEHLLNQWAFVETAPPIRA